MAKLKLTRNQFAAFLPDNESVKQFETLFDIVDNISLSGYQDALLSAGIADSKAQQALDSFESVSNENLFSALNISQTIDYSLINQDLSPQQAIDYNLFNQDLSPEIQNNNSTVTDYVDFAQIAPHTNTPRRLTWNEQDGTLDLHLKGGNVTLQIGQEQVVRVVNKSGANLTDGQVVYLSGAQGNRVKVDLAVANGSTSLARTVLGLVTESIPNNQEGFVTISGLVRDLNTSTFTDGDVLYLSTTPGAITNVKPTPPTHAVIVGFCVNANPAVGSILVSVSPGYDLEDLSDVAITTPANNDLIRYDSAAQVWKNTATGTGVIAALGFNVGAAGSIIVNGGVGSFTSLAYTTTLTGGTGIVDLGSGQFYKDASGNVGIGTASPVTYGKLAVVGNVSGSNYVFLDQGVTTGGTVGFTNSNSPGIEFFGTSTVGAGAFVFKNAGTERVRITNAGNVGIGTINPVFPLEVAGFIKTTRNFPDIRMTTTNGRGWRMGNTSTGTTLGYFYIQGTSDDFTTSFINSLNIDASANIINVGAGGLGYGTGSGGAVTQLTSRATGVTLDKTNGAITMFSAAGSATAATFTVTNSKVAATDTIVLSVKSSTNVYLMFVTAVAAGSFNITFQTTGGVATDAPVINFAIIKAVTA